MIQGVLSHYFPTQGTEATPVDLLVAGSVPPGSGVSSSAAMVVASTLAFLAVNNKVCQSVIPQHKPTMNISCQLETTPDHMPPSKGDLILMAMENEKRVGVNSGGYVTLHSYLCIYSVVRQDGPSSVDSLDSFFFSIHHLLSNTSRFTSASSTLPCICHCQLPSSFR